ncbi:hypothetical protein [Tsukamurella pulmonis]|uniref:hypothetical protein n=1 Tax=Tsukamurella pulmonis TaxID=47312 RepID=UPI001111925C|nr:hypothetical protein [Tsukamurella pulmonis]
MANPHDSGRDTALSLSAALQRAFTEAGNPSLRTVAASGTGVSRQRLSDWRAGRHLPASFGDLEPVLRYLSLAAEATEPSDTDLDTRVTRWPLSRWQQIWQQESSAAEPARLTSSSQTRTDVPTERETTDRRPLAIAIITLLVILVAALAAAAYIISVLTL